MTGNVVDFTKEIEKIKRLQEEIREFETTAENRERKDYWEASSEICDALARPIPKEGLLPFTVDVDRIGYADVLGFSLADYLNYPELYVLYSLEISSFRFKELKDCTPIKKAVSYFTGSGFEKSLFGGRELIADRDAWVGRGEMFSGRPKISDIPIPDFFESPAMKEVHAFCERMQEIVDDDFAIEFPQWNRSSWGVAWHLRGIDNLLIDYIEDPQWFADFLDFLNDARIQWAKKRCGYFKEELQPCSLFNDEVTVPVVSPAMYNDVILPTEKRIGEFYGGINYWHSCGQTTPLMKMIDTIPNLAIMHVGAWSDLAVAAETFSPEKAFQVSMRPYEDIIGAAETDMAEKLSSILELSKGRRTSVSADALQVVNTPEKDMDTLKTWISHANRILLGTSTF